MITEQQLKSRFSNNYDQPKHNINKTIIFTKSYEKARKVIDSIPVRLSEIKQSTINRNRIQIDFKDGREIIWAIPSCSSRGSKCSKAYIDSEVDYDLFNLVISRCCTYCTKDNVHLI